MMMGGIAIDCESLCESMRKYGGGGKEGKVPAFGEVMEKQERRPSFNSSSSLLWASVLIVSVPDLHKRHKM